MPSEIHSRITEFLMNSCAFKSKELILVFDGPSVKKINKKPRKMLAFAPIYVTYPHVSTLFSTQKMNKLPHALF